MVVVLALVCVSVGAIISVADPPAEEGTGGEGMLLGSVPGPDLLTAPESPAEPEPVYEEPEPVYEEPEQPVYEEPEPEIVVTEPATPEPTTPEPTTPEPTTPEPTTPEPTTPEPTTPAPESDLLFEEPEPLYEDEPELEPLYEDELELESPPEEETEAEAAAEAELPYVVVTMPYVPVTISFASEEEIVSSIRQFLEENAETLTEIEKSILQACIDTAPAPAGYSAQWVSRVYSKIGVEISGNARDMWNACCTSSDRDELKPGMLVAVSRSNNDPNTWGYYYGRIGIYVGDGMVVDSASRNGLGVKTLNTLDNWLAGYDVAGTARWGYPGELGLKIAEPGEVTGAESVDEAVYGAGAINEAGDGVGEVGDGAAAGVGADAIGGVGSEFGLDGQASGETEEDSFTSTATPIQIADVWALTSVPVTPDNFYTMVNLAPSMTKEELVALGIEMYGVDSRWMQTLIGTTVREGYVGDPYLYYAWSCAMLNLFRGFSADALYAYMDHWGSAACPACGKYYSERAVLYGCSNHPGYISSWEYVLKCIYLAMVNRDYRIAEVDGMISLSSPPSYLGTIYVSPIYDCQVWTYIG